MTECKFFDLALSPFLRAGVHAMEFFSERMGSSFDTVSDAVTPGTQSGVLGAGFGRAFSN